MAPVAKTPAVKKATFQDNVKAALMGGKASAQAVLKHVAAARNLPVEKCRFLVKVTLKKMVDAKLVTQLKGTGATGSFKLTKAALAPPKAKKPVKKTVAKKVIKKVTKTLKKVTKKTTKKAPKPSGAAKKPAAAKKAPAKKAVAAKKAAPKAAAKAKAPAKKTIKAAAKAYRAPATSAKKAKK